MNKIICGDCIEVMQDIPNDNVDFIFYDPPYNVKKKYDSYNDNLPINQYFSWMRKVIQESKRISKRGLVVLIPSKYLKEFITMSSFHPIIIHKRAKGVNKGNYSLQYYILLSNAEPTKRINDLWNDIRLPGEGFFFREEKFHKINPGFTSLELTKKIIDSFSLEKETILDPFAGIGTTGVACKELNRSFIGIEQSEEYCKLAKERIENTYLQEK